MAAVGDGEFVTKFLFRTYRLQPTRHDVVAVLWSACLASVHPPDERAPDRIPLISGSSAELYIKPMLSCVDDVDVMFHFSNVLAIPAGYPAPTQLPDEFHSRVKVFEIIDSEYPGYVYLKPCYLLTEMNDEVMFNAHMVDNQMYLSKIRHADAYSLGPAETLLQDKGSPIRSLDKVECVRCLSWPPQAAEWPMRPRNNGWPDSASVHCVVSNGCHVVSVAHRLCRNDEWESKAQWRLSFSRAEIILLNSWGPAQQIVYHMLRFFMKTAPLTDVTEMISNYNIKTLNLWACELKPGSWWNENANVVTICVELLHTVAVWLTDSRCPHYFIRDCNLMDTAINSLRIAQRLTSVTVSWLSEWFVNKYVLKCAQLCPDNVARLFDDISTSQKRHNAASAVVAWRRNTALYDLADAYELAQCFIDTTVSFWSQTINTYVCIADGLAKLNLRLSDYLTAFAFLHIAIKYANHDVNIETMDILSTACGQFLGRRRHSSPLPSAMLLSQAVKLMKVVVNTLNSGSTVQLIEIELSKSYLYRALRCKDSDKDSICCLANVYLAVVYYTTGQYQTAIDHCTLVTRSQDQSLCSSHVVQGELLPKINAGVDNILGLTVFYQHVLTAEFKQQPSRHVSVFSTELFAHYMLLSCLSATELARTISASEVQHGYCKNVSDRQKLFIDDLLLFKSLTISSKFSRHLDCLQGSTQSPTDMNTSKLVELLQQSAVEHLTTFRQFQVRVYRSVCTIVTTDFEAMYAYKRGDYQLCLQLSTQNVRTLLYAHMMSGIFTFPEFIQLLDDDIVSLTALTLMVNPECRGDDNKGRHLNGYVGITQLTLSVYLMTQCQLKLCHSATQLAQTLDYIQVADRRQPADYVLTHLTLKLSQRKTVLYIRHNFE